MVRLLQMLAIALVAMLPASSSLANQDQISNLTAPDLARGQKFFVAHCAVCHGIGGTGGRGPSLTQPELRRAANNQALFRIIQTGIEGTEMPGAWQMTDREIWQLAGYVRSLGRTTIVKLPGDPAKGKELFEAKGRCQACHIVNGRGGVIGPDLTNIGAQRSPAYLRESLIDPSAQVPEGYLVVTAVTRDGQRVTGNRVNEDSFTIQLRGSLNSFYSFRKLDLIELKKEFGVSTMPAYRDSLSNSELDDLVAYLAGLRGDK